MLLRLVVLGLAAISIRCRADVLALKNGKEYTGVFVSGNETRIRFNVGHGSIRSFPTREVDHIQFGSPAAATASTANGASVETAPVADTSQPVMRASEAGPAPARPTPTQKKEPPPPTVVVPEQPPLTVPEVGTTSSTPLGDMGAINSEYTAQGSDAGVLGPPRAPSQLTADKSAVVRFYQNGAIYWTSGGGAHAIYGPIFDAWMAAGGEHSRLGYPTSDRQDSNAAYNQRQSFQHGSISWNPKDGAQIQY